MGERARQLLQEGAARLGLELPAASIGPLLWLVAELLRWNRSVNLTAIRQEDEAIEKHLLDSLSVLPLLPAGSPRLLDLGSGAGFPGLPLKIVRPELGLVSVEAVAKKVHFQRHVLRHLRLTAADALAARAETLAADPRHAGRYDLVTSRAVADLARLAALARPLLTRGGCLPARKGPGGSREAASFDGAQAGFGLRRCHELRLPQSGSLRTILVYEAR